MSSHQLVDHLFRSHAGQLVAWLTRIFGPAHLELAEEVVQEALLKALQQWIVTDGKGRKTTVSLENLQAGIEPDPKLFVVKIKRESKTGP